MNHIRHPWISRPDDGQPARHLSQTEIARQYPPQKIAALLTASKLLGAARWLELLTRDAPPPWGTHWRA